MPGILWLASYPKSGNTWLRAFLANYFHNPDRPIQINGLPQYIFGDGAAVFFEKAAGRSVADFSPAEIQRLRPAVHNIFAHSSGDTAIVKTHNAISTLDGIPTITPESTAGAIYIVRNPLDVAVSYAHHFDATFDWAIEMMASEDNHQPSSGKLIFQHLGSWSSHLHSWTTAPGLTCHVVRYEDMARSPYKTFREVVKYLALPHDPQRLRKAIGFSSFKTLAGQEADGGFVEAVPTGRGPFFRKGRVGDWRDRLSAEQAQRIIDDHRVVMSANGYLKKDGRPVF